MGSGKVKAQSLRVWAGFYFYYVPPVCPVARRV